MPEERSFAYDGKNHRYSGPAVIENLKKILKTNKYLLRRKLSGDQRFELAQVEQYLNFGCTGKKKWAFKNYDLLGQFVHTMLNFPPASKSCKYAGQDRQDNAYKETILKMVEKLVGEDGEYQLGWFLMKHNSFKDDNNAGCHFHLVFSRFRYHLSDSAIWEHFALKYDRRTLPLMSLYFLDNPIALRSREIRVMFLEAWRRVIHDVSKESLRFLRGLESGALDDAVDIEEQEEVEVLEDRHTDKHGEQSVVDVISKSGQNTKDRFHMIEYARNPALHTFRYIMPSTGPKGWVRLTYLNKNNGEESGIHLIDNAEFALRYLIRPNRRSSTLWNPRGFLYHSSRFHHAAQAIRNLGILDEGTGKLKRVVDLPIHIIGSFARDFRAAYDADPVGAIENFQKRFQYLEAPKNEYLVRRKLREAKAKARAESEQLSPESVNMPVRFKKRADHDIESESGDDDLI